MKLNYLAITAVLGLTITIVGCGATQTADEVSPDASSSSYIIDSEPDGAIEVGDARLSTEDKQAITLVGLIGGSPEPFVDGIAAFTIVDQKIPFCADDEGCPTPWDYCCTQDQVQDNIATIKIVDETGNPVAEDARELLGVKELSTVVIKGTVERDPEGNLTVAASEVFVRKQ